jgi:hypothetical protein
LTSGAPRGAPSPNRDNRSALDGPRGFPRKGPSAGSAFGRPLEGGLHRPPWAWGPLGCSVGTPQGGGCSAGTPALLRRVYDSPRRAPPSRRRGSPKGAHPEPAGLRQTRQPWGVPPQGGLLSNPPPWGFSLEHPSRGPEEANAGASVQFVGAPRGLPKADPRGRVSGPDTRPPAVCQRHTAEGPTSNGQKIRSVNRVFCTDTVPGRISKRSPS